MAKQPGFWDVEERSEEISADGDTLETLAGAVDFERFRPILERAAGKPPGPKGGRPALDVVPEFRMLVLQSLHGLSLAATEAMVRDRPGWMRFCGLELRDRAPDANTLRDFREAPVKADALDRQVPQGEAPAGRRGAGGHRHPGVRLQVPHRHRPEARDHPAADRHGRRRP